MCDACSDFLELLVSYERQVCKESTDQHVLTKQDIDIVLLYVQSWPTRQCMCCYRDPKNFERFSLITQGIICLAVCYLKDIRENGIKVEKSIEEKNTEEIEKFRSAENQTKFHNSEKLLNLISKIFLLNFPLYAAFKHSMQSKLEEVTQQELQNLNTFCDLHDSEIPIYLLRNVCLFCKTGGVHAMTLCFQYLSPETLPVSTAHAIITVVCNLKLWLNFKTMLQLLVPLRSRVLRYMCKLSDQDLRAQTIKSMADFMWNAIKDPLDTPLAFDSDGLNLAFKYFTSTTLTMRLAGISQINSHIGLLAELCVGEGLPEAEGAPKNMADWLQNNNIISHIFGPNLHVEVIKQSHIILNFLAMEGRITCDHIDIIWQAAQLKHCAKPVHDLLPGLIKHLAAGPALHLYSLLVRLEPKEHTEQTLYLASTLIKFIWTRGGASTSSDSGLIGLAASAAGITLHKCATSSENSVSLDGSNSDEEQGDSSGQSESHKSESEEVEEDVEDELVAIEESEGPTPCKQPRKHRISRQQCEGSTTEGESGKDDDVEDDDDDDEQHHHHHHHHKVVVNEKQRKSVRKKIIGTLADLNETLPEGVENIGSSSSQDEADTEETPSKFRKRRKVLRKRHKHKKIIKCKRGKREICVTGVEPLSDKDADADSELELKLKDSSAILLPTQMKVLENASHEKSRLYIEESSSSSEIGKEVIALDRHHVHLHGHAHTPSCTSNNPFLTTTLTTTTTTTAASRSTDHHILDMLSGEEAEAEGDVDADADGSYSSRMSNKSEKNMADFDGEDSACEEELAQLAVQAQLTSQCFSLPHETPEKSPTRLDPRLSACFKVDNVCQPGNTLLWDLLQDNKITQLGEGLALEAEKALCNLLCYNTDRVIRLKFIEGCLKNLANNWSVIISLRLLTKLLSSFQQYRGLDTHHVTHWAEREHNMMSHFFNNLKAYFKNPKATLNNLYTHQMQVQVRLHFLFAVFSPLGSPPHFKLSLEQVDTLWECLAHDPDCSDELFSWLLSQAKSSDLHALGIDALKPRIATAHMDTNNEDGYVVGMDHMWKIALRANNTDVSMAAIQYLNSYYMGQQLQHEGEFVSQCMTHLAAASQDLCVESESGTCSEEGPLLCIQRALLLLKTHLETFRRRYAYHLRRWALEGKGIGSHAALGDDNNSTPIRVIVQPAGMSERATFDLLNIDYVADLRAEVTKWWESLIQIKSQDNDVLLSSSGNLNLNLNSNTNPVLGSLLHEGPIRMITQGQELTIDCDEKTLQDVAFKDNQMVYISMGVSRDGKKRDALESPSVLPPPPRESIPTLLLLRPIYFEQLFDLMHTLSCMKTSVKGGHEIPHTKAQVLSRRVWDILTLLPTSPTLLRGFQHLDKDTPLSELLDPANPQKLMYSLYIVESLGLGVNKLNKVNKLNNKMNKNSVDTTRKESWSDIFTQHGGLRHLFDIFMSGVLQKCDGDCSEWQQDCLASLLKLLCQLGVVDSNHLESSTTTNATTTNRTRIDKIIIPSLNETMIQMMKIKTTMPRLTSILQEASMPRDPNHYKTGFWGRAQVIHYAMSLLVSWLHCSEEARQALFQDKNFAIWLQRLVLEDPEPAVRREVCSSLYRLCLGSSVHSEGPDSNLVAPMLSQLLEYMPKAESMRPQKFETIHHAVASEEGKEPYGPACRDYFWLVSRLIDSIPDDLVKESIEDPQNCSIDLNGLAKRVCASILNREFLETRHHTIEDDGLIGLLNLMSNIIKHHPPFQTCKEGQELIQQVFSFLFALPTPRKRHVPKCKSPRARTAAFDLLVELVKGAPDNYAMLYEKLLIQHKPGPNSPYPWDYWPHEDGRSECGYVGLTNLGATCYMASCMQHLYMMPQARTSILGANCANSKHEPTLRELQKMFAYLLESERKAYNPRSFCKVYTMDHQPLNTGEQKDMAEFFIDLVSKLEEMTPELKTVIKKLFCGVLSNNVVSLDCDHVSRTVEEFYTVRCQVADMRNLYESLDEVTVKDTLEGDNMYTCSQCGKKVRAEKRACFKKLPHILCFNTMRYTFNMLTMLKEKVNTHFSFPLRLNMEGYLEKHLMPQHYQEERLKQNEPESEIVEQYEYDLIGVTVHTGTADGGHYYSFIKDRSAGAQDKWLLFNDAEVKPFDPNQIAAECFGGEMTSKTYDSVTDKFMDFSFEKTNSAYMLFYEKCPVTSECSPSTATALTALSSPSPSPSPIPPITTTTFELSKELEDWIWQDNMHFIQDKNIFEHTYFNFMWQICGYIPQTILPLQPDITLKATRLSTSFFIETFIHAKEKPTAVQWVELVTKQFNACQEACQWFLDYMAEDTWWPVQVLIKCPNQMVRQMFQRLCIHVIQRLRQSHASLYLLVDEEENSSNNSDGSDKSETNHPELIGNSSCVTKFVKTLLSLMEHGAKAHLKHLTEYFGFLYEFSRMGDEEAHFLIAVGAIHTMVQFYLGHKAHDFVDVSDGEEEEEVIALPPTDKYKPASLDKMITLVACLVERSRGPDLRLMLSAKDYNAVAGGKGFPFLYQQIKDNINLQQTRNLIHSLCRGNERLATLMVTMLSQAISRHSEACQPFFKLLTLLTEAGPSGLPCFTQLVLQRVWEAAECCPHSALDWLAIQVARSKLVHQWVLQSVDTWLEHFLLAHNNQRVRAAAAFLLVSLVPSPHFRQGFRASHRIPNKEPLLQNSDAQTVLHQVYTSLLRLLGPAKHYTDIQTHGTMKLTTYFALLTYCVVSKTEKLMFGQYFLQLWHLFHPKLSEPSIPAHHNKQALLVFWHHVCMDCPENIQLILQNAHVTKNIAFNYILADHEDQEVVMFNRAMLPAYYGLLRMCCQLSRTFTRHLASHQNLQWAFKNITPHPTQYPGAVDELFKLMQLFVVKHPDCSEQEQRDIHAFRRSTLSAYLQSLDGRTSWSTFITAFRILIDNNDDRLYIVYNGGLQMAFESFQTLHAMYHEATACHVTGDILDLLSLTFDLVRCLRMYRDPKDARSLLLACKDWAEVLRKLATLLNTYNPPDMRNLCIELLKELVILVPTEVMQVLIPLLSHCHAAFQDSHNAVPLGPYFPRRGHPMPIAGVKGTARPLRPMVQMAVPHNQLELQKGIDADYDESLEKFYAPYHEFIDMLCRLAVNADCLSDVMVTLSAMVGFEAVPLHSTFFPKLWLDILHVQHVDRNYISMLVSCNYFVDYVDAVLLDERLALTVDIIYEFLTTFFPKVASHVLTEQTCTIIDSTVTSLAERVSSVDIRLMCLRLIGDLRALILVYSTSSPIAPPTQLIPTLNQLKTMVRNELANFQQTEEIDNKNKYKGNDSSESDSGTASCSKTKDDSIEEDLDEAKSPTKCELNVTTTTTTIPTEEVATTSDIKNTSSTNISISSKSPTTPTSSEMKIVVNTTTTTTTTPTPTTRNSSSDSCTEDADDSANISSTTISASNDLTETSKIIDKPKSKNGPKQNLKLLESTINELFVIIEKKS